MSYLHTPARAGPQKHGTHNVRLLIFPHLFPMQAVVFDHLIISRSLEGALSLSLSLYLCISGAAVNRAIYLSSRRI